MTINIDDLKKKIVYRSTYRGTKEMDLLLGNFVKIHIEKFNESELKDLDNLIKIEEKLSFKFNLNFLSLFQKHLQR